MCGLAMGKFIGTAEDCGTVTGKDQRSSRADLYRKWFSGRQLYIRWLWRSLGNTDYIRKYFSLGNNLHRIWLESDGEDELLQSPVK